MEDSPAGCGVSWHFTPRCVTTYLFQRRDGQNEFIGLSLLWKPGRVRSRRPTRSPRSVAPSVTDSRGHTLIPSITLTVSVSPSQKSHHIVYSGHSHTGPSIFVRADHRTKRVVCPFVLICWTIVLLTDDRTRHDRRANLVTKNKFKCFPPSVKMFHHHHPPLFSQVVVASSLSLANYMLITLPPHMIWWDGVWTARHF